MIEYNKYIPSRSEQRARLGARVATVLYFVVIFVALIFTQCNRDHEAIEEQIYSNSLMISLGDSEMGSGELATPEVVTPSAPNPVSEVEQQVEQLTDEQSDVEYIEPVKSSEEVKISNSENNVSEPKSEPTPPREVNRRALFPGSSNKSSTSHGSDKAAEE